MKNISLSIILLFIWSIGYMTVWAERQVYGMILTRKKWGEEFDSDLGQRIITYIQFTTFIASIGLSIYLFSRNWRFVVYPAVLFISPITRGLINIVTSYVILTPLFFLLDGLEKLSQTRKKNRFPIKDLMQNEMKNARKESHIK